MDERKMDKLTTAAAYLVIGGIMTLLVISFLAAASWMIRTWF